MKKDYSKCHKHLVAVDCIIFGFDGTHLNILLTKKTFEPELGKWNLIGDLLLPDETADEAASRILYTLTGLENIYLEQLSSYTAINRGPDARIISISYYSLINLDKKIKINSNYNAQWFDLKDTPPFIFDHAEMIKDGVLRLRRRASTRPIGFELLPEKFTMKDLQNLYEAIFDVDFDQRNFVSKINSLDILERTLEKDKNSSKKGSFLYRFDEVKYKKRISEGVLFKI